MTIILRRFAPALLSCIAISLGSGLPAHGTMIWQAAQTISGDSDVSAAGTLVQANDFNLQSPTVNGTTFMPGSLVTGDFTFTNVGSIGGGGLGAGQPAFNSLSGAYQTVLYTQFIGTNMGLTINNLTPGHKYLLELWSEGYNQILGDSMTASDGNSVVFQTNTTDSYGGLGQYITGTFTAGSSGQESVSFNGTAGYSLLSAVQLRNVPDSGPTLWLTALSFTGILLASGRLSRQRQAV